MTRTVSAEKPVTAAAERRYINIFGEEVVVPEKRTTPLPRGHAAPPGSGPQGETCGSCEHIFRKSLSKTYIKCALARARWTGGGGTDIRVRDPACRLWEKAKPDAV